MSQSFRWAALASLAGSIVLASCGDSSGGNTNGTLTINSSSVLVSSLRASLAIPSDTGSGTSGVDVSSLKVGMYALYASPNADCSSAVLVQDYGATPSVKDFVAGDVLFSASPPNGSYKCLAVKMSDVIGFTPATSMSPCQATIAAKTDIYPAGSGDFKDVSATAITGHGTTGGEVDDKITLIFTTDPAAAQARGFSVGQIVPMLNTVTVPTTGTIVWSAKGLAKPTNFTCSVSPSAISFR
jgi:hypothetical protein